MSTAVATIYQRMRASSLSIGKMTFGGFSLVFVIIIMTSAVSVYTLRDVGKTFAELQRLQRVGDVSEQIDRRVNELRLAARDYVIDPNSQSNRVWEALSALSILLTKTRDELGPEQQRMLESASIRLTIYREGITRVSALIDRRTELLAQLALLRGKLEPAVTQAPDSLPALALLRIQSRIASALLARDPAAASAAAQEVRSADIADPVLRNAINDYVDGVKAVARTETEITTIDRDVLGAEGRAIGVVTEQLREASVQRGQVVATSFAGILRDARWRAVLLGIAGVLIGSLAAFFVVRLIVRPLGAIASAIRSLAAGDKQTLIPATDLDNEIGDIARASDVFRQTLVDADDAREAALRALTEQRLAEESYRKLFEDSVDGIYVTTPSGTLLNANPALATMMGYASPLELIQHVGDIAKTIYVDPTARSDYQARMTRDGVVREFEYQVRQRDGAILWLSDSATVVRDQAGRVARYEGTVRDITNQKRAEEAVRESRRLLQQVIDTVPAVINVKDRQLRYVLMNRYMARVFSIEPEDAIGRTTSELMSRYGAEKTDENDRRLLAKGDVLGFYEEEYKDSSGAMRQWLVNKLPLRDNDDNIDYIVTVALDIGERKRGEQDMREAKDAAEAALRNLRDTQNSLIEAEKLAALGRLVAGVAHEVNNPVGISLTVASSLERKVALFANEVARGDLRRSSLNDFIDSNRAAAQQLVANLNRAAELIQSFKQVAADRNYSDQREFDLADLTEQVVLSLKPGLRKQNLALVVECQPNLVMNSYPGPYGQVLTNLFLNAVAHAFPNGGGGTVTITTKAISSEQVEIVFADDGCGMTSDVRRRAFDPFFTTRRDKGGTGLGLHIAYSIVTSKLGGRISLSSAPGEGSRIIITLPRDAPPEHSGL